MPETVTVTMPWAVADGLRLALDCYCPQGDRECDMFAKSKEWIRVALKKQKGDQIKLTAKPKSFQWLVERVVKPGKGYAAAAIIVPVLSNLTLYGGQENSGDCE